MGKLIRTRALKLFIFIFTFYWVPLEAAGQFYTSYCSGDSAYDLHNYELAIILYQKKLNSRDTTSVLFSSTYQYGIACSYALLDNTDSAFKYIDGVLSYNKLSDASFILSDQSFIRLHADKKWKQIEIRIKSLFFSKSVATEKELAYELFKILSTDQEYRSLADNYQNIYGRESPKIDSIWRIQNKIDSLNMNFLIKIINEKSTWPGKSLVGDLGNSVAFMILQHANLEIQKKYFSLLKQSVDIGESNIFDLALLEDRILVSEGKAQLYGSQLETNKQTGKMELSPIQDEGQVDQRRAQMGLTPLKQYLEDFGIQYVPLLERKQLGRDDTVRAPLFRAIDINGDSIISENYLGKVVVLNFWYIRCKPCIAEMPSLNILANKFKDKNVVFISITQDSLIDVKNFLQGQLVKFSYRHIANRQDIINKFVEAPLVAKGTEGPIYQDIRPANIIIDRHGQVCGYSWGGNASYPVWMEKKINNCLRE